MVTTPKTHHTMLQIHMITKTQQIAQVTKITTSTQIFPQITPYAVEQKPVGQNVFGQEHYMNIGYPSGWSPNFTNNTNFPNTRHYANFWSPQIANSYTYYPVTNPNGNRMNQYANFPNMSQHAYCYPSQEQNIYYNNSTAGTSTSHHNTDFNHQAQKNHNHTDTSFNSPTNTTTTNTQEFQPSQESKQPATETATSFRDFSITHKYTTESNFINPSQETVHLTTTETQQEREKNE